MYSEAGTPVVIDNGSFSCKAGLSGDDAPRTSFPSVVGIPKYQNIMAGINNNKDFYVGDQALAKKGVLKLNYPIEHGIINNWDDMQKIWHYCFYNELRVTPSQHPCLLTQPLENPKFQRQRTTQIMFETFDVPAFYLSQQTTLSLYSSGKTTGLVLDCGNGVTQVAPIYQGYPIPSSYQKSNVAGRDLTEYMKTLLNKIGLNYTSSAETQTIRDIKQKHGYVALDFEQELKRCRRGIKPEKVYELPDGQQITIDKQRFMCPQALFKPYMLGQQAPGVHEMVYLSIEKCDLDIRKDLYSNIVLTGGSTMFLGFQERLNKEITDLASSTTKVKIFNPQERMFFQWIGGSILSSLTTFKDDWITKAQYYETGSQIIHQKCL